MLTSSGKYMFYLFILFLLFLLVASEKVQYWKSTNYFSQEIPFTFYHFLGTFLNFLCFFHNFYFYKVVYFF